jgi:ribose transport system substrate-binding protein
MKIPFILSIGVATFFSSATLFAKDLLIGFSQVTLQSPFYVELKTGAEAAAAADGDKLIFLDANGDVGHS